MVLFNFGFRISACGLFEQPEEIIDGNLVELGKRITLPFPTEAIRLETHTMALRTQVVGAEAGKEDPHMHLVGVLFQPTEEALQAIPSFGPFFAPGNVAGFAI